MTATVSSPKKFNLCWYHINWYINITCFFFNFILNKTLYFKFHYKPYLAKECLSNQRSPFEGCFTLFTLHSHLNNGVSNFLKGEWRYARAYSPFWRVNVFTLKVETPLFKEEWRVNELGWMKRDSPLWRVNIIRVNQIRLNNIITLMNSESKRNPRKKYSF